MRLPAPCLALLLIAAAPEPRDIWVGPIHGPVPATLAGGTVVRTPAVQALLQRPGVVVVDVSEAPRRPRGLAPGAPWLPLAHRDIPGSIWIPGAGRGIVSAELAAYYRERLAQLTGAARDRPILVYCHPRCWMSWNAARRAIGYGYRRVFWYPDGIEAWQRAGLPMAPARAEGPDIGPEGEPATGRATASGSSNP